MLRHRLPLLLVLLLLVACGRAPEAVDTDTDSAAPASTVTTVVEKATVDAPASPAATTAVPSDGASAPETEAYPAPSSGVSDAAAVDAYPAPEVAVPGDTATEAYPESATGGASDDVIRAADAVIAAGEYAHETVIGKVTVYWSNDDQYLYLAAEAETAGWLGIGLDPENRMQGANYIIAADRDGAPAVYDAYGQGAVGATHPEDVEIGGSDDLVASAVSVQGGVVRLEAQIPLDSGDQYDKVLQPGETYPIIVATGTFLQFSAPHDFRALGEMTLD